MTSETEGALRRLFAARPEVDAVALFGSFAQSRERADSDLDLYVRLRPGARWSVSEQLAVAGAASAVCRREVDLVVEDNSTSVILRREVANRGRPIHEARTREELAARRAARGVRSNARLRAPAIHRLNGKLLAIDWTEE